MRKITNNELNRIDADQYKDRLKSGLVVVLDNVRSAQNVGSFFRTSDAFGIDEVVLCGISATPPSKEIHKTALGAEMSVSWRYFENTSDAIFALKSEGYKIISVEQVENAVQLHEYNEITQNTALVFGNEVDGVDQFVVDLCDTAIEIPQCGIKHSLNVSVAAGVVLWHFYENKLNNE